MEDRQTRIETYRNRAEELRAIADTLHDPQAKAMLLRIANDYIRMAEGLEKPRI